MTGSLHGLDQTPWIRTEKIPALQHLHRKIIKKLVFWEIPNDNGFELPMVWVNPNGNFPNHWGCFEIPMVWVITNRKRQVLWTTHWVWTLNVVPLVNTGKELSMKGRLTVLQMFLPFSEFFFLNYVFSDLYIYICLLSRLRSTCSSHMTHMTHHIWCVPGICHSDV